MSHEEQAPIVDETEVTTEEATEDTPGNESSDAQPRRDERGGGYRSSRRRRAEEVIDPELEQVISQVIGSAIDVHKAIGPGFDREVYVKALLFELNDRGVSYEEDHPFEIKYRDQEIGSGKIEILVDESLVLTVKTVHRLTLFDKTQMISTLRASELDVGLMLNFHAPLMKDGLQRVII